MRDFSRGKDKLLLCSVTDRTEILLQSLLLHGSKISVNRDKNSYSGFSNWHFILRYPNRGFNRDSTVFSLFHFWLDVYSILYFYHSSGAYPPNNHVDSLRFIHTQFKIYWCSWTTLWLFELAYNEALKFQYKFRKTSIWSLKSEW